MKNIDRSIMKNNLQVYVIIHVILLDNDTRVLGNTNLAMALTIAFLNVMSMS